MQTRLRLILLAVVVLSAGVLAACGGAAEVEPSGTPLEHVVISFPTRSAASWPLFIAKEGGYYEKYGLDVDLEFAVHPAGIAMVSSGEAVMTNYSLETAMQAGVRDGTLVVAGSPLNKAVFALVAENQFTRPEDLRGKRIAISQIGDAPSNYATALIALYGLSARDVEWIPIGSDANGRAAALVAGRAEATMLTAPAYFKLEDQGYNVVANMADHDEIFAATTYLFHRDTVRQNPDLVERIIKAHAEAIQRFYDDKAFAVEAYRVYDPQTVADVERFYDIHFDGDLFERVPYVLTGAIESVAAQQTDAQLAELMQNFDFHQMVDNSFVRRLVEQGFFEDVFGPEIQAEQERKAALAF